MTINITYIPSEHEVTAWFWGRDGLISIAEWDCEQTELDEDEYEAYDYLVAEELMK
jgi:hypothetical protein